MSLTGLFYESESLKQAIDKGESCSRKRRLGNRLYCYTIAGLLWFSFLRYIPSFWVRLDHQPDHLIDRVVHVIFFLQCALMITTFISHCQNPNQLTKAAKLWEQFFSLYNKTLKVEDEGIKKKEDSPSAFSFWDSARKYPRFHFLTSPSAQKIKPRKSSLQLRVSILRSVILAWFSIFLNIFVVAVFVFGNIKGTVGYGIVICDPFPAVLPVEVFFFISHCFDSCAWIFPAAFTWVVCFFCHFWFSRINDVIVESFNLDQNTTNQTETSKNNTGIKSSDGTVPNSSDSDDCANSCITTISTGSMTDGVIHREDIETAEENETGDSSLRRIQLCSLDHLGTGPDRNQEDFENDKPFPNIENLRRLHLMLCTCVEILDQTMSRVVMTTYASAVPIVCFLLYNLVNSDLSVFETAVFLFWFLAQLFQIITISVSCARVHKVAHSPLKYLYYIDVTSANAVQRYQLQLFLSQLNGPAVGFTALGLITVTKEMMLTVGGLLVTYFFLLLQFKI